MPTTRFKKNPIKASTLILILGATGLSWLALVGMLRYWTFHSAEAAYQDSRCEAAISNYNKVIDSIQSSDEDSYAIRSEAHKSECQKLMAATKLQASGNIKEVFTAYGAFIDRYPKSPLLKTVRQQFLSLFAKNKVAALAQTPLCDRVDIFKQQELFPNTKLTLPLLYQDCGQMYSHSKQYSKAVKMYEQFLASYPDDGESKAVKGSLANALIAEAMQKGAIKINQPGLSGMTLDGSTVINVRNDMPVDMRLIFSGPETQYQEIEPCVDCQKYVGKPPDKCPAKGVVGSFVLQPGTYNVLVKSASDGTVRPFVGKWILELGSEYEDCFMLVTNPREEQQNSQPSKKIKTNQLL
jgi:tetratricopeptide (TPR) repeat protein